MLRREEERKTNFVSALPSNMTNVPTYFDLIEYSTNERDRELSVMCGCEIICGYRYAIASIWNQSLYFYLLNTR